MEKSNYWSWNSLRAQNLLVLGFWRYKVNTCWAEEGARKFQAQLMGRVYEVPRFQFVERLLHTID